MLFRMNYAVAGGHVHIEVFAGKGTGSLAHCGKLVMRQEEWDVFKAGIERTIGTRHGIGHEIEFVTEI